MTSGGGGIVLELYYFLSFYALRMSIAKTLGKDFEMPDVLRVGAAKIILLSSGNGRKKKEKKEKRLLHLVILIQYRRATELL